jgi:hypothetical protein
MTDYVIATPFPEPDRLIRHAFGQLRVAKSGTEEEKTAQLGDVNPADLPRPWDPPSCPPALRKHVWVWLDRVAAWINREYTWQVDRLIPSCWPAHPHIAHELGVVAAQRYDAGFAYSPDSLEDWHRYALPGFLDRTATRLGPNACPPGQHRDWPGIGRFKEFESPAALERRGSSFDADLKYAGLTRRSTSSGAADGSANGTRAAQLTVITSTPAANGGQPR